MTFNETDTDIARAIQSAVEGDGVEFAKKVSYIVGNATAKSIMMKDDLLGKVEKVVEGGATLQSCSSIGKTAFSAVEDLSRNDKLCTGLCVIATTCEGVAIVATACKFIPDRYRYKVYIGAKGTSLAVMKFRNLCRNAQGHIGPC
jgi:hypothetical protein